MNGQEQNKGADYTKLILVLSPLLLILVVSIIALCIVIVPFAFLLLLTNMLYNKGRINFKYKKPSLISMLKNHLYENEKKNVEKIYKGAKN